MIRKIRNYILEKTDYLVIQSKEKNQELTQDFISYREDLRNLPQDFNFFNLTEEDYNNTLTTVERVNQNSKFLLIGQKPVESLIDTSSISFFPLKPIQIII